MVDCCGSPWCQAERSGGSGLYVLICAVAVVIVVDVLVVVFVVVCL